MTFRSDSQYESTGGFSTATFNIEACIAAVRQGKAIVDDYRRGRDIDFALSRERGVGIWAWDDRGVGEEWVVSDELFDRIKALLSSEEYLAPPGQHRSGVGLWKLSDAIAAGFVPFFETVADIAKRVTRADA